MANPKVQEMCTKIVDEANDKLERDVPKIEKLIDVCTFFGGLLLYGLTGSDEEESVYTTKERNLLQLQILAFSAFFGTIVSAIIFLLFTEFKDWTEYGPYKNLGQEIKEDVYVANEEYDEQNENHKKLIEAAKEEGSRRNNFRRWQKTIVALSQYAGINFVGLIVFESSRIQLGEESSEDLPTLQLQSWVVPGSILISVIAPLMAAGVIFRYTGRIYDVTDVLQETIENYRKKRR